MNISYFLLNASSVNSGLRDILIFIVGLLVSVLIQYLLFRWTRPDQFRFERIKYLNWKLGTLNQLMIDEAELSPRLPDKEWEVNPKQPKSVCVKYAALRIHHMRRVVNARNFVSPNSELSKELDLLEEKALNLMVIANQLPENLNGFLYTTSLLSFIWSNLGADVMNNYRATLKNCRRLINEEIKETRNSLERELLH